ncbi:MAG: hypothetical protein J1E98_07630 [Lachnospiraceae bacterium]|nr:hypothetical protein [Lachnospiraceae bacterium]
MRINYNASAMRANNALNRADNKVSSSLRKLSSGFKVNSAKDNPSGYAIGRRMNTQIEGVSVATRNANTGISIIETADGALTEVHDMLQRMNELAIKGATGTMTTADRAIVNEELAQLKKEVTRVAKDTEFNGQNLLDGCFDLKGYTNNLDVKVGYYSDEVLSPQVYTIDSLKVYYHDNGKIDLEKTNASFKPGANFPTGAKITSVGENCITIQGPNDFEITLDIDPNMTYNMEKDANTLTSQKILTSNSGGEVVSFGEDTPTGNYNVELEVEYNTTDGSILNVDISKSSTNLPEDVKVVPGATDNEYIIRNDSGFEITVTVPRPDTIGDEKASINYSFDIENYTVSSVVPDANGAKLEIDITGIGAMDTQIGANEGQVLEIRIPTLSLQRLGLTNANLLTQDSSSDAIVAIKGAIAYTSAIRSRLGAYQNRLEHTVSSLDITNENMTAAYSRIMDVDFSEEMTTYTSQQVVEQAAVSMLAQANERPSMVLQLLQ